MMDSQVDRRFFCRARLCACVRAHAFVADTRPRGTAYGHGLLGVQRFLHAGQLKSACAVVPPSPPPSRVRATPCRAQLALQRSLEVEVGPQSRSVTDFNEEMETMVAMFEAVAGKGVEAGLSCAVPT
jgi:hypothetical protein